MERATRQEWAKRVERWRDSGLTAKEFAAELNVSANSLTFWKWKLRQLESQTSAPPRPVRKRVAKHQDATPTFLQLVPTPASSSCGVSHIEVLLPRGIVIRVPMDFDESALLRLVGVLGAS
jgi:hypothetical protein